MDSYIRPGTIIMYQVQTLSSTKLTQNDCWCSGKKCITAVLKHTRNKTFGPLHVRLNSLSLTSMKTCIFISGTDTLENTSTGVYLVKSNSLSGMSHVIRKLVLPYANNNGADQPAHPRSLISAFVIRCLDSIIPLVSISKISSL